MGPLEVAVDPRGSMWTTLRTPDLKDDFLAADGFWPGLHDPRFQDVMDNGPLNYFYSRYDPPEPISTLSDLIN